MLSPEQIKSQLRFLEERGALNGKTVFANIADDQDECCTPDDDQGGSNYDPPGSGDCDWDSGFAPEQYHNVCDDVEDCETGKPIDFSPQGFTQPERCKECGPDEMWDQGYYWKVNETLSEYDSYGDTPWAAVKASPAYPRGGDQIEKVSDNLYYWTYDGVGGTSKSVVRAACPPSQAAIAKGFETCASEAPELCGDNWESDSKTTLTIKNGCFVASKCDPDAAASDLACQECMDLCRNGVQWTFCATDDGGWVQYDKSAQRVGGKYDKYGARKKEVQPGQEGAYL